MLVARDTASVAKRLVPAMPRSSGWLSALLVTAIGAVLRLWNLGQPHAVIFDETYYPKDALGLLRFGVEQATVADSDKILLASDGNWQTLDIFTGAPAFIVHPPLGKWIIGLGEMALGATPTGWRIGVAIVGIIAVLLTARIARRLTRSNLVGFLAGLFVALDGMHIVMSRTGLLDIMLGFFVLIAFGCLLLDRDHVRTRLAALINTEGLQATATAWGPKLGLRPWRWAAAFALGLGCSVKWSGIWFALAFIAMSLVWDISARRVIGVEQPWRATLFRTLPITALVTGVIIVATYLMSWTGWFISDDGYDRTWAGGSGIAAALSSLWHYHSEMWSFHVGLTTEHAYASNPWGWLLQARPTSFYWNNVTDGTQGCPTENCAAEVLALGNPVIWWTGILAIIYLLWRRLGKRDWRAAAVLVGIAAGWLPWMLYLDRTIFTFYTVVFMPFIAIALAMAGAALLGPDTASVTRRRRGLIALGVLVGAVIVVAWWLYPVWTGELLPYNQWQQRMWLPSWV
ncbi:MAG: phospholipid carrier-dependent glycosyltransferase [Actinomycetota bacterium]|nr:phospholipid carrier-dependent glycosyltransferase [Actinomycetota bacterium]